MQIEIEDFLLANDDAIPLQITGVYHRAVPAHTPRGEYAPIDPPEPAMFEIEEAMVYSKTGLKFVHFPLSALSEKAYEALTEKCISVCEEMETEAQEESVREAERNDEHEYTDAEMRRWHHGRVL